MPVMVRSGEKMPVKPVWYCESGSSAVPGTVAAVAVHAVPEGGSTITKEVALETRSIGYQPAGSVPAVTFR
jgi:hypothetical protein